MVGNIIYEEEEKEGTENATLGYPTRDRAGIGQAGANTDGLSTVSEERLNPVEEIAGNAITHEFVYKFRVRYGVKCSLEVNVGNNCRFFVRK